MVIRDDAVLTNEPLRYANECVRHKILDIVGDLSLLGKPCCADASSPCGPATRGTFELAKKILEQVNRPLRAVQTFAPPPGKPAPEAPPAAEGALDVEGVMKALPHRPPFLFCGPRAQD